MATSVIDYIFRDLAISYLKRTDLGQVKPDDLLATGTSGQAGGDSGAPEPKHRHGEKHSAGFRPHGSGAAASKAAGTPAPASGGTGTDSGKGGGTVKAAALGTVTGSGPGASAAAQPAPGRAGALVLEQSRPEQSELIKIAQARIKGYEGDPCPSCGSFTLIRNGTCMKCDTCGGTTGCS
jgi:ribonucleoside-diphosphate reductase alpha chain